MINPSATATSRGPDLPQTSAAGTALDAPRSAMSAAAAGGAAPAWPNPSLRIDPALGIVVMEFRDKTGIVEAMVPTERQLEAYRILASRRHPDATGTPAPDAPPHPRVPPTGAAARIIATR
jgi:hypothetical protein